MKKSKLKFWLITVLILWAVPFGDVFWGNLLKIPGAGVNPAQEIWHSILYSDMVTILCTALILYHLKFRK